MQQAAQVMMHSVQLNTKERSTELPERRKEVDQASQHARMCPPLNLQPHPVCFLQSRLHVPARASGPAHG